LKARLLLPLGPRGNRQYQGLYSPFAFREFTGYSRGEKLSENCEGERFYA
jgi:hypothetical protein